MAWLPVRKLWRGAARSGVHADRCERNQVLIEFGVRSMKVLVTGAAGFIGMPLSLRLLARGDEVVGLDNLNDYYDVTLKRGPPRAAAGPATGFASSSSISPTAPAWRRCSASERFDRVIHLAAQAGVRYSLQNPHAYVDSNLVGFVNVLEGCRHTKVSTSSTRSSSSVYGGNTTMPFSEHAQRRPSGQPLRGHEEGQRTDGAHLQPPVRPADHRPALLHGVWPVGPARHGAVPVHQGDPRGHGRSTCSTTASMQRDFTYIDDIVEGVVRVNRSGRGAGPSHWIRRARPGNQQRAVSRVQHRQQQPVPADGLHRGHRASASAGRHARTCCRCKHGDVPATYADVDAARRLGRLHAGTPVRDGVARFVAWYRDYYGTPGTQR